jgi:hypothetical protein
MGLQWMTSGAIQYGVPDVQTNKTPKSKKLRNK